MMKRLEHCSYEARLGELGLLGLEKRGLGRELIHVYKYLEGGCQEDGVNSCQLFLAIEWEAVDRNWNMGSSISTQGKTSYCMADRALVQVAQNVCGVSLPKDIQKLCGHT